MIHSNLYSQLNKKNVHKLSYYQHTFFYKFSKGLNYIQTCRISSNKRPGAYKIFSQIAWALIGGGRLFQISKNVLNRKIKKAIDRLS